MPFVASRDFFWRRLCGLCFFGVGLCGFRTVLRVDFARALHRLRAPRRGARGLPRAGASAAVLLNRPCRRNLPPLPARAVCRRQTAPDAGLRRCLIPAFFCSQKSGRPLCIVKEHGLQLLRIYSTIHLTTSLLRYGYLADAGKRALHAQNRLPHRILIVKRLSRHKRSDPVVWS